MVRYASRGQENVPNENHDGSRSFRSFKKSSRRIIPKNLFAHPLGGQSQEFDDPVVDVKVKQTRAEIRNQEILIRNQKLALIIAATHSVGFLTPIWVIFGTDHLGLSLFASLVLGSTGWVSSSIFEVPMGAFGDKYGRQLSLIIGLGATAIGDLSLAVFHNYWILMLFQVISGIGFSMRSGSLEGLLHDTYAASDAPTKYAQLSSQMLFLSNGSRIFTVPIGAWLYNLNPNGAVSSMVFPYIASASSLVISLVCAIALVERRSSRKSVEEISTVVSGSLATKLFGHTNETWIYMRSNRYIIRIVVLFGLYALIGEGNWALYQSYFREKNIGVGSSGWVYAALVLCMTVGSHYVSKIYRKINVLWLMTGIIALVTFGIAWMHLPFIIAFPAFIMNAFLGPMCLYLQDNAIQNRVEGDHKTTALSISSMSYNVGSMVGIFGIGAIADRVGVLNAQWGFVIYGIIVTMAMSMWCWGEGFAIEPEDAAGAIEGKVTSDETDSRPIEPEIPYDEASQLSPKTGV